MELTAESWMLTPSDEWDDFRIEEEIEKAWKAHGNTYQYLWVRELARRIKTDLQVRIAYLEAQADPDAINVAYERGYQDARRRYGPVARLITADIVAPTEGG